MILIGGNPDKIVKSEGSIIQSWIPKLRYQYNSLCEYMSQCKVILQESQKVYSYCDQPLTKEIDSDMDNIDWMK